MNLFKTTVFRMALTLSALFATISVITLLSVYFVTIHEFETQTERELLHEISDLERVYADEGVDELKELVARRDEFGKHLNRYYTLTDGTGGFKVGSGFLTELKATVNFEKSGITFFNEASYRNSDGDSNRVRYAIKALSGSAIVYVGQAQDSMTELREHIFTALLYAVIVTLLFSVVFGSYMGRLVLSRIQRIDTGMENAINTDFKQNLAVPEKSDEFQALTIKLNVMVARIETLIQGMRQVTDNIAHDLRSPLNRLRSRLEVTLLQPRDVVEYKDVMGKAVADCDQLLRTFNSLLSIAQLESGVSRDKKEPIDLCQLADELADLYQPVAEDKGLAFIWTKPESVCVLGIRQSLAQAINNLLENAVKYTPAGGKIELLVIQENKMATITVNDTGPGIPPEFREKALQRFQRLDSSRSETGNGLGLSLVNAVAKLHDAKLVLEDHHPGLSVKLTLNAYPCAASNHVNDDTVPQGKPEQSLFP